MSKIEPETIRNKLIVTREKGGGERGIMGKIRERIKLRNMYKGPMDMDNRAGMDCGSGGG